MTEELKDALIASLVSKLESFQPGAGKEIMNEMIKEDKIILVRNINKIDIV